jgi:hypothetical protein
MSVIIELPDDLADILRRQAEARGEDVNNFVIATLTDAALQNGAPWDDDAWWNSLSGSEKAAEIHVLRRSMAEANAGAVSPSEDVFARLRARRASTSTQ